jgi:hypothetical protein
MSFYIYFYQLCPQSPTFDIFYPIIILLSLYMFKPSQSSAPYNISHWYNAKALQQLFRSYSTFQSDTTHPFHQHHSFCSLKTLHILYFHRLSFTAIHSSTFYNFIFAIQSFLILYFTLFMLQGICIHITDEMCQLL